MYTLDAISAVFTVLFKGKKGEAYNASNPDTFLMVRDLATLVFDKFNPNVVVEYSKVDTSVKDGYLPQRKLVQSIDKIKEIGWRPYASLEDIYRIDIARFSKEV